MPAVIELTSTSKRYQKLDEHRTLMRSLPFGRAQRHELWALRDLDLTVGEGETLGVLGHNGAGKTTLLRLLAGVTSPTIGTVRVRGRIAPLISLGVGFHPEMTGRENVLVNGMLLGLSSRQVAQRFDEIVEFSELEAFIDTPVKFYSSGMFMRLGFAVIAHIDPKVLLVDEILAVGDAGFQFKCFERLRALQQQGAAIVMVSHSTHMIRQLCQRAILIRHGRLEHDGDIETTIARHESVRDDDCALGSAAVEFTARSLLADWLEPGLVAPGAGVEITLHVSFLRVVRDPVITVAVFTSQGLLGGFNATPPGQRWRSFEAGERASVRISFPAVLAPGEYTFTVEVKERDGVRVLARADGFRLTVAGAATEKSGVADLATALEVSDLATSGSRAV